MWHLYLSHLDDVFDVDDAAAEEEGWWQGRDDQLLAVPYVCVPSGDWSPLQFPDLLGDCSSLGGGVEYCCLRKDGNCLNTRVCWLSINDTPLWT